MRTKLVYVLTCAEEHYYIEWALISLCSLRKIHPEAYVILLVDDLTNNLLVGKRAEILSFVSEKIVARDCPADMDLNSRSRYLKTSVRQRIKGDFLFVDCDTVVCKPLDIFDELQDISACLDSHLYLNEYAPLLYRELANKMQKIGMDIANESAYYNSGIMFVPDSEQAHELYASWHKIWLDSLSLGIVQDQPALAKANKECNYVIHRLPDVYNCIVYTQNTFIREANILHISSFENPSYLFSRKVLSFIKENSMNHPWIQWVINHPHGTMWPFDYAIYHSTIKQRILWIHEMVEHTKNYVKNMNNAYADFPMKSRFRSIIVQCFKCKMYHVGVWLWMLWKRLHLMNKGKSLKDNVNKK